MWKLELLIETDDEEEIERLSDHAEWWTW